MVSTVWHPLNYVMTYQIENIFDHYGNDYKPHSFVIKNILMHIFFDFL